MMTDQSPMRVVFDAGKLTLQQRDGLACVTCGQDLQKAVPVGLVDGGQVFACSKHAPCPAWCTGRHGTSFDDVSHRGELVQVSEHDNVSVLPMRRIKDATAPYFVKDRGAEVAVVAGRACLFLPVAAAAELADVQDHIGLTEFAAALRTAAAVLQQDETE